MPKRKPSQRRKPEETPQRPRDRLVARKQFEHGAALAERRRPLSAQRRHGQPKRLEGNEQEKDGHMQRVDPAEPQDDEPKVVRAIGELAPVAVGDDEAGQHEEVVDEEEGSPNDGAFADRTGSWKMHHRDQDRADTTPRIERFEAHAHLRRSGLCRAGTRRCAMLDHCPMSSRRLPASWTAGLYLPEESSKKCAARSSRP